MLRLFKKSDEEVKENRKKLEGENALLDKILLEKRKELKYIESPLAEKLNILQAKENELEDLLGELGERKLKVERREQLVAQKEKLLRDKEIEYLKKTV